MRQAAAHTPVCGLESHMEGGAFFAGIRMATGRPPGRPIRQGAPARKAPRAPVMRPRRNGTEPDGAGPCRGHARPMQAGRVCRGGFRPPRSRLLLGGHAGLRRPERGPPHLPPRFFRACAAQRPGRRRQPLAGAAGLHGTARSPRQPPRRPRGPAMRPAPARSPRQRPACVKIFALRQQPRPHSCIDTGPRNAYNGILNFVEQFQHITRQICSPIAARP